MNRGKGEDKDGNGNEEFEMEEGGNIKSVQSNGDSKTSKKQKQALEKFFAGPYSRFVFKLRFIILAVLIILVGVGIYGTTQIKARQEPEDFLPSSHPISQYFDTSSEVFLSSEESSSQFQIVTVHQIWGIEGIDRSEKDASDASDLGEPVYDPNFSVSQDVVGVQNWMLDTCLELSTFVRPDTNDVLFEPGNFYCFMEAFQDYTASNSSLTFPVTDATTFIRELCIFAKTTVRSGDSLWDESVSCDDNNERIIWFHIWGVST